MDAPLTIFCCSADGKVLASSKIQYSWRNRWMKMADAMFEEHHGKVAMLWEHDPKDGFNYPSEGYMH